MSSAGVTAGGRNAAIGSDPFSAAGKLAPKVYSQTPITVKARDVALNSLLAELRRLRGPAPTKEEIKKLPPPPKPPQPDPNTAKPAGSGMGFF